MTSPIPNRPRRRFGPWIVLAPAVVAAWALVPVTAASGQVVPGPPVIELVPPTPQAGVPLTGVQHLKAQASVFGIFKSLHLIIRSDDPSIPAFEFRVDRGPSLRQQEFVTFDWDTRGLS